MVKASVTLSQFRQVYIPMFTSSGSRGPGWRPCTTGVPKHLHPSPAPTGDTEGGRAHLRHAALAPLGDNITTDHLSPSNAIPSGSAAGDIWRRWACRGGLQLGPPTAAII